MPERSSMPRSVPSPYGAAELQQVQPRVLLMSFFFSAIIVQSIAAFLSWWSAQPADDVLPLNGPRDTVAYHVLWDPPIDRLRVVKSTNRVGVVPTLGIPVPVAEHLIDTSIFFPTTEELAVAGSIEGEVIGPGSMIIEEGDPVEEPEPAAFVPREVEPVVAFKVDPVYPPVAVRAGLEGNVYVMVWVDTKGSVRKAVVVKSDGAVFDEAALEAVRGWVFTPALMQNRPVSVWVTVPFRFRMQGR